MTSATHRDQPAQTNLSPSGAFNGTSTITNTTPVVDSPHNGRSDSVDGRANHSPIAPPAHVSRRNLIMNSIVSAAAVASATAIPNQSIAKDAFAPAVEPAPDPIFDAIEAHRQTYTQYLSSLDEGADEDVNNGLETTDQTARALLTVEPTTIVGAAAVLAYFAEQIIQDDTYFPEDLDRENEPAVPFAAALAQLVSRSLYKLV
ncbi:MAG: hypothetical protein KGL35_21865 [Bradyrhizobium sp.]|uniref:hypothetical protein n=1 Tax=Bradyrhizobium sp. TaxID=376 RepID=UPI001C2A1E39|nr:hypothetical protein [Bradyrhizobium sp.]MBU6463224.1 hypothetical protein [Pseudomonadota bacterium]MDE2068094.1 hypothetical protein [Bradyrhizobium sp.]MDE2471303.1 hypothetical protein [Bradyrhizobium sp.]